MVVNNPIQFLTTIFADGIEEMDAFEIEEGDELLINGTKYSIQKSDESQDTQKVVFVHTQTERKYFYQVNNETLTSNYDEVSPDRIELI